MARALRAWAIKERKNSVHSLPYGPSTRLIRGIYSLEYKFGSSYRLLDFTARKKKLFLMSSIVDEQIAECVDEMQRFSVEGNKKLTSKRVFNF